MYSWNEMQHSERYMNWRAYVFIVGEINVLTINEM